MSGTDPEFPEVLLVLNAFRHQRVLHNLSGADLSGANLC